MSTLFLENTYSVNLAGCYFSEAPVMQSDWLCITLYYDNIIALLRPSENSDKGLISFLEHPLEELIKVNYTGQPPYDTNEINLNAIRICHENKYDFLPNLAEIHRDEFISYVSQYLPETIPLLKHSFFKFDILYHFIVKNTPALGGPLTTGTRERLVEFKNSDLGKALVNGINEVVQRNEGHYYATKKLEEVFKNEFISIQQEFLAKLDFDKISKFKLGPLLEDGIGTIAGLVMPFLPLGTLKEIFNYAKTQYEFKKNTGLQFMLSIFYLQKILNQEFGDNTAKNHCVICQTTEAEIKNLNNEEVHNFIFRNSNTMCFKHLTAYLFARKFASLNGHRLLLALKSDG